MFYLFRGKILQNDYIISTCYSGIFHKCWLCAFSLVNMTFGLFRIYTIWHSFWCSIIWLDRMKLVSCGPCQFSAVNHMRRSLIYMYNPFLQRFRQTRQCSFVNGVMSGIICGVLIIDYFADELWKCFKMQSWVSLRLLYLVYNDIVI